MVRAVMAEATEHHRPGEPPPIRDEAADTPLWLPVLGLCFLLFGAFALIWQSTGADEPSSEEAAAAEGEATAEEAADGQPAAEEPAPAEAAVKAAPSEAH